MRYKKEFFTTILLLLTLLYHPFSNAEESPARFDFWRLFTTANSGLPRDDVSSQLQASDGIIWIGTSGGGLASLNEGQWEVYDVRNSLLPSNYVTELLESSDGAIWIGTWNGGLARLHDKQWTAYNSKNSKLPNGAVRALESDTDGSIWIGTEGGGLARLNNNQWTIYNSKNSGLPSDHVSALERGADGAIWIGTWNDGLARLHDNQWTPYNLQNSKLPNGAVRALESDTDGGIWIGTEDGGLARLNNNRWTTYNSQNSELPSDSVTALESSADGTIWIGLISGGVASLHDEDWKLYNSENSKLPNDLIRSLMQSADGALWIGVQSSGIARLHHSGWQVFGNSDDVRSFGGVRSLLQSTDDAIWMGTFGRGAVRHYKNEWRIFDVQNSGLTNGVITTMMQSSDDAIWMGTFGDGVARLHKDKWKMYNTRNSLIPDSSVSSLLQSTDGAIWVATDGGGLAHLHNGKWQLYTSQNSQLPSDYVTALVQSSDGAIWIGTRGDGIASFHNKLWKLYNTKNSDLPDDNVQSLMHSEDGEIWIGTYDSGVARFDGNEWHKYNSMNSAIPDENVTALMQSSDGAIWIGSSNSGGLARLHEDRWQSFNSENSKLPDNDVRALMQSSSGAIWVGTNDAVARFYDSSSLSVSLVSIEAGSSLTQSPSTFAARGHASTFHYPDEVLNYDWTLTRKLKSAGEDVLLQKRTYSPFLTAPLRENGEYSIAVRAVDANGRISQSDTANFDVKLREPQSWWQSTAAKIGALIIPGVLLVGLVPLLILYPHASWARTLTNSGVFNKVPILHKLLLNSRWARKRLFYKYGQNANRPLTMEHYIDQEVFPVDVGEGFVVGQSDQPLSQLVEDKRCALIIGRSGTGKSVLMTRLNNALASNGLPRCVPVLVNAPTHLAGGESLPEAIKSVLRREGKVEISENILDFLISKGGFVVIVDSLNENEAAVPKVTSFINKDANNHLIVASQYDPFHNPEIPVYQLQEVTEAQAMEHVDARTEPDTWNQLPERLRSLSRNPNDLDMIVEVIKALGVDALPERRSDLYAKRVQIDTALRPWAESADRRMDVLYGMAFRMFDEQRSLDRMTLALWLREALQSAELPAEPSNIDSFIETMTRSRQFREAMVPDRLGQMEKMLTFDHELAGKYLASRHLQNLLSSDDSEKAIALADDYRWQDVFLFLIDGLDNGQLPDLLLYPLIRQGGETSLKIVAYALSTQTDPRHPLPNELRDRYSEARIRADVQLTPGAGARNTRTVRSIKNQNEVHEA